MNTLLDFIPQIRIIFGNGDVPQRPSINHEKILEDQRKAYQESMERLESMRRDAAYAYEQAEIAAREERKLIRRENNETIE
ncbi:hypothetical protein GCK72_020761 [Caenorhabditis remanei]|nr:hypothetical protein GCK72_020761 [Caenorhabditis remanei]KAF1754201.1 hypothetical protein GCK72_020761 [Caenorhabditis remanei]